MIAKLYKLGGGIILKPKKYLSFVIATALTIGMTTYLPSFAQDAKTITIIHTNDTHARVQGDDKELIGYAKLKTFYEEQKAKNPSTILIDAGDTIHGTIFANVSEGKNMINLMNDMGFVLSVPGNHDFNYGYEKLIELTKQANFPYLSANVMKKTGGSDFAQSFIKEIDGVKVGFFGLSTPETSYKSSPKNTQAVDFVDYIKSAQKEVDKLKADGAQVIIGVTHLGLDASSVERSDVLAQNVKNIDLIIDGHSHTKLTEGKKVDNTMIVQTGEYLKNIGVVDIKVNDGKVEEIKPHLVSFEEAKSIKPNLEIQEKIKVAEELNKPVLEKVIGKTSTELVGQREKVRTGETNLGDLVADAMKDAVKADVTVTNAGGIRASIKQGDIKMGDVLTAFPFTNFVVGLEVKGDTIKSALEHGVDKAPEPAGKFPQVAGMEFFYDISQPAGQRVKQVTIDGQELDLNKTYKLATNDFMAIGGDDYKMFLGNKKYAENALLSDVLVEYIKSKPNATVNYKDEMTRVKAISARSIQDEPLKEAVKTTETALGSSTPSLINHKIVVNNKSININGYLVNGDKYFQIRDLALAFKNSKTPFDVEYDKTKKSIMLKPNKKYMGNGIFSEKEETLPKLTQTTQKIMIDGKQYDNLKVYLIDNYNYFKFDDVKNLMKLEVK